MNDYSKAARQFLIDATYQGWIDGNVDANSAFDTLQRLMPDMNGYCINEMYRDIRDRQEREAATKMTPKLAALLVDIETLLAKYHESSKLSGLVSSFFKRS